jgi:hypothetical protein
MLSLNVFDQTVHFLIPLETNVSVGSFAILASFNDKC